MTTNGSFIHDSYIENSAIIQRYRDLYDDLIDGRQKFGGMSREEVRQLIKEENDGLTEQEVRSIVNKNFGGKTPEVNVKPPQKQAGMPEPLMWGMMAVGALSIGGILIQSMRD